MIERNAYRTEILPIDQATPRPVWSVMIPTYHCATYLRETLTSVLSQDPGSDVMQIEVVDDGSIDDNPQKIVEEIGQNRIHFYQQPQNVGHILNFQTCLNRARGHLIHLLHGDDCVCDGFYRKMQQTFERNPEIGAAYCRHQYIDDRSVPHYHEVLEQPQSGILEDALGKLTTRCRIQTPSIVVRRSVYETIGAFDRRLSVTEDWEMWVRIAAYYPIGYETETLALYRTHQNSNTARHQRAGKRLQDLRRAIDIMQESLPPELARQLTKSGREYYGADTLRKAEQQIEKRNFKIAVDYIREALLLSRSPQILQGSLRLGKRILKQSLTSV